MINSKTNYSPVNYKRINPQFVGITGTFSSCKQKRLSSEKEKKSLSSNYNYMSKLNCELDRNIQLKKKQLLRLQKIRQRHNSDIKYKLEQQQRKRTEQQELHKKSTEQRNQIKNGIQNAQEMLQNERTNSSRLLKKQLHEFTLKLKDKKNLNFLQNSARHNSIEVGKKLGNEKINFYYRQKNKKQLDQYLKRIDEEDFEDERNRVEIRRMKQSIKDFKIKANSKQEKLKKVMEDISIYSTENQHERKANMLATTDLFRHVRTTSSFRSTNSDIARMRKWK